MMLKPSPPCFRNDFLFGSCMDHGEDGSLDSLHLYPHVRTSVARLRIVVLVLFSLTLSQQYDRIFKCIIIYRLN